jgi:hypothetical protein
VLRCLRVRQTKLRDSVQVQVPVPMVHCNGDDECPQCLLTATSVPAEKGIRKRGITAAVRDPYRRLQQDIQDSVGPSNGSNGFRMQTVS